jgi:hypothetical protein
MKFNLIETCEAPDDVQASIQLYAVLAQADDESQTLPSTIQLRNNQLQPLASTKVCCRRIFT